MLPFRSSDAAQASHDMHTYIPPSIERAMTQHAQQYLPQHVQQQVGSDAYIPKHLEKTMSQAMKKNLPPHMQPYINAYMQQRVVSPGSNKLASFQQSATDNVDPHAPTPYTKAQNHFQPDFGQPPVDNGQTVGPNQSEPEVSMTGAPVNAYEFITNPEKPPRQGFKLPGNSMLSRVAIVGGGLLVLLIVGNILKGLIIKGPDYTGFVSVAQDQQAIIHVLNSTSESTSQQNLSTTSNNFATTAQLSLTSSQSDIIKYLALNHYKVKPKILAQKASTSTDEQLQAAAEAATYDQTFQQIMVSKLNAYINDLKKTYSQNPGPKGKALLNDDYLQAKLLLIQLSTDD